MQRIRWFFVMSIVLSVMALFGPTGASAQTPTPIAVPTVTTAGCDQVAPYVEARQQIMDELLDGIAAVFPTVGTPITEHGDQLAVAMFAMTSDQAGQIAAFYDETANKIEKLDVPDIARFYNEQTVALYRMSAKTFAEVQNSDLVTAGQIYGDRLGTIATAIADYGQAAVAACPAFAKVIEVDQTKVGM